MRPAREVSLATGEGRNSRRWAVCVCVFGLARPGRAGPALLVDFGRPSEAAPRQRRGAQFQSRTGHLRWSSASLEGTSVAPLPPTKWMLFLRAQLLHDTAVEPVWLIIIIIIASPAAREVRLSLLAWRNYCPDGPRASASATSRQVDDDDGCWPAH